MHERGGAICGCVNNHVEERGVLGVQEESRLAQDAAGCGFKEGQQGVL